ncbi:MAG: hypothetical protein LAP40_24395 [Acidobacteriia bacterium]|nr:hypothetical protein [Terriglobia bacterium]
MKVAVGFGAAVLLAAIAGAQNRGGVINPQPFVQGSFGNIVFPGGTSTMPGIQRTFGNAVFPGGGGPRLVVPFSANDPTLRARPGVVGPGGLRGLSGSRRRNGALVPYALPVFVGGFYDNPYLPDPAAPQQPNIVVIYPPAQQPVILNSAAASDFAPAEAPVTRPAEAEPASPEPEHYLIAFKDRTIYAAVAYWVDGDTLHYFTAGNTHNQVSLSLVDKALTERLNQESGTDLRLP